MLYSCNPASGQPTTLGGRSGRASGSHRRFAVDLHCHVFVPEAHALVGDAFEMDMDDLFKFANEATNDVNAKQADTINEQLTSVERRLADMDAMGVDVQAISPAPLQYYYALDPELGRDAARVINDRIATIAEENSDRIVGLANLPMQSPEFAVAELERAVKDLGLRGCEISTNVAGAELSDERVGVRSRDPVDRPPPARSVGPGGDFRTASARHVPVPIPQAWPALRSG